MTKKKSLLGGGIAYMVYNVFSALFPFISLLYVTRVLSSSNIGEVSYALNIVSYFVLLAFVGIPTYGMREIAKYQNNPDKINKTTTELMIINTVSTTISLGLFIGLVFMVPSFREEHLTLYLVSASLIALNYFNISWLFEGLEKFGLISLISILSKILSFVFLVLFVRSDGQNIAYALVTILGMSGYYVFLFALFPKYAKFTFRDLHFRQHFKPILFLVVVNLAIEIYSLVDITMIGAIMSDSYSHVTYYKYAHQIQRMLLMFINTIATVVVPRLTILFKEKKTEEYNSLLTKSFNLILILAIPIIIGITFVSDSVLVWLYGEEYIVSSPILKVLSATVLISPISYLLGSRVCLVTGNEKIMPIPVSIGAVVNVGLNALFIWLWGEMGAAFASVVSETIVCAIYISFSHKMFKLNFNLKNYLKLFISLVVMTGYLLALYFLLNREILKVCLEISGAIAIYFGLLFLLKEETVFDFIRILFHKEKVGQE